MNRNARIVSLGIGLACLASARSAFPSEGAAGEPAGSRIGRAVSRLAGSFTVAGTTSLGGAVGAPVVGAQFGGSLPGGGFGGGGFGGGGFGGDPEQELAFVEAEFKRVARELEVTRQRLAKGLATQEEVSVLQEELNQNRGRAESLRPRVQELQLQRRLWAPVQAVEFRAATLDVALKSLAQGANVRLRSEGTPRAGITVTLVAQDVPLALLLGTLGDTFDMMIARDPSDSQGILFKPWPMLEVNGRKETLYGRLRPWADQWLVNYSDHVRGRDRSQLIQVQGAGVVYRDGTPYVVPGSQPGASAAADGTPSGATRPGAAGGSVGRPSAATRPRSPAPAAPRPGGGNRGRKPSAPTLENTAAQEDPQALPRSLAAAAQPGGTWMGISSLGANYVVVAERGKGPNGEPGVWLTVYYLADGLLRRLSALFHPLTEGVRAPSSPASPPMGGGGLGRGGFGGRF